MIENIPTPLVSFAGSGIAGFFIGIFLRRVLEFLVIIIGSFSPYFWLFNGCRRVNISKDKLTGIEWHNGQVNTAIREPYRKLELLDRLKEWLQELC
jgi:hypothetical protein